MTITLNPIQFVTIILLMVVTAILLYAFIRETVSKFRRKLYAAVIDLKVEFEDSTASHQKRIIRCEDRISEICSRVNTLHGALLKTCKDAKHEVSQFDRLEKRVNDLSNYVQHVHKDSMDDRIKMMAVDSSLKEMEEKITEWENEKSEAEINDMLTEALKNLDAVFEAMNKELEKRVKPKTRK